ncbi:hypothetical protein PUR23_19685 [Methylorubrum populi]|uniref:hypothetical protein n=1 Tax=Methylorubrum populi TaxID=223967 RepID=UPI0031F7F274
MTLFSGAKGRTGGGAVPEAYVPLPDGSRVPIVTGARSLPPIVRDALIQARAALRTAASDTAADLDNPERARVIEQKIALLNDALAALGSGAE